MLQHGAEGECFRVALAVIQRLDDQGVEHQQRHDMQQLRDSVGLLVFRHLLGEERVRDTKETQCSI